MPHVVVDDQLAAALEHLDQRDRAVLADQRDRGVDLDHRQPPPGGGDGVALAGVRLLPDQQLVELRLPARPVHHRRPRGGVVDLAGAHLVNHDLLHPLGRRCHPRTETAAGRGSNRPRAKYPGCCGGPASPAGGTWAIRIGISLEICGVTVVVAVVSGPERGLARAGLGAARGTSGGRVPGSAGGTGRGGRRGYRATIGRRVRGTAPQRGSAAFAAAAARAGRAAGRVQPRRAGGRGADGTAGRGAGRGRGRLPAPGDQGASQGNAHRLVPGRR